MKPIQLFTGIVVVLGAGFADSYALANEGVVRAASYGVASHTSPSVNGDFKSTNPKIGLGVTYICPSDVFADFSTTTAVTYASFSGDEKILSTALSLIGQF
jgi:hypothetical protein